MSKIRPVRWLASQASSGLKDLPRNGEWLLSRALPSPGSDHGSGGHGAPEGRGLVGGLRRLSVAVGDAFPGVHNSVETRLRRAEAAVASARKAEQQALEEAQNASDRADAANAIADEGKQRLGQATRDGQQEVDQRTREAQEHVRQLVEQEREKAERDVTARLEHLTAEVEAHTERARKEAEEATQRARAQIEDAHQRMATARALAAEATEAAQETADQTRQQATAVADDAEQRAKSADQVVSDAHGTERVLARDVAHAVQAEQRSGVLEALIDRTKAELLVIAEPLQVGGAAQMTKNQLVRSIRNASRTKARN